MLTIGDTVIDSRHDDGRDEPETGRVMAIADDKAHVRWQHSRPRWVRLHQIIYFPSQAEIVRRKAEVQQQWGGVIEQKRTETPYRPLTVYEWRGVELVE